MDKNKQPIFIKYANSLYGNAGIFREIFEDFKGSKESWYGSWDEHVYWILKFFLKIANCNDLESAKKLAQEEQNRILKQAKKMRGPDWEWGQSRFLRIAFEAVYGYRDNGCEKCHLHGFLDRFSDAEEVLFKSCREHDFKCYQCVHIAYTTLIHIFTEKHEYFCPFGNLLSNSTRYINTSYEVVSTEQSIFKTTFRAGYSIDPAAWNTWAFPNYSFHNLFVEVIVFNSLLEWLLVNDRQKLKYCSYCGEFYIANDIRQQRCKKESCKKSYEKEKKQKQRDRDPVKYM